MRNIVLSLILAASFSACVPHNPPGGPPTAADAGTTAVNCVSGVAQAAIADAVARVDTVIASGVASGAAEAVIIKQLEGLAVDLGPQAFACALQYVSAKFSYDANHSGGPVAANKAYESQVAHDYLDRHAIVFAVP